MRRDDTDLSIDEIIFWSSVARRHFRFDYLRPTKLAAIPAKGARKEDLVSAWTGLFNWLTSGRYLNAGGMGYGLTYVDPKSDRLTPLKYVAGVELPSSLRTVDKRTIAQEPFDGGAYVILEYQGPFSQILDVTGYLENNWNPSECIVLDSDRAIVTLYHSDPHTTPEYEQSADICVPVKPALSPTKER